MKTTVLSLTTTFFIAGMLMTGCGDNSKKDSKEVQTDIRETDQQFNQRTEDSRAEARQDWEDFKAASDEELEKREKEIKDLRAKIAKADKRQRTKLNKDLDELDRKNKELKERIATRSNTIKDDLNDLNEKVIKEHKAAQRELKHDMDELGKALGNLFKKIQIKIIDHDIYNSSFGKIISKKLVALTYNGSGIHHVRFLGN